MKQIIGKQASKLATLFFVLSLLSGFISAGLGIQTIKFTALETLILQWFFISIQGLFAYLTYRALRASRQSVSA